MGECNRKDCFRIVSFDEWKETLDSILKIQEETIKELKERFVNAEKEHDMMLVPYAKQFYFQKLTQEYMNYLDNKLMKTMAERMRDHYVFAITPEGLPMLLNKKTYEMSTKFGKREVRDLYH